MKFKLLTCLLILCIFLVGCQTTTTTTTTGGSESSSTTGGSTGAATTGGSTSTTGGSPETVDKPHPLASELPITSRNFKIGTGGFIPPHYPDSTTEDWQNFFQDISESVYGELYGVHHGWNVGEINSEGIPQVIATGFDITEDSQTETYLGIGFDPQDMTESEAAAYLDENGDAYKETVLKIVETYKPGILMLMVEGNHLYEKSPEGYDDFVEIYKELYDEIKEIHPNTKVTTNIQYEYALGKAAITGRPHEYHLDIIEKFGNKLDIITLTVYPYFDYNDPNDIPVEYLDEVRKYTSAPLMITETGWPSKKLASIEASEQAQVDYLFKLLEITEHDGNFEGIIWVFPNDGNFPGVLKAFNSISLRDIDGNGKKAWGYWQALKSI